MHYNRRAVKEQHSYLKFLALDMYQYTSVVAIAQLVEPRIVIPVVEGSSPFSHPILFFLFKTYTQTITGDSIIALPWIEVL